MRSRFYRASLFWMPVLTLGLQTLNPSFANAQVDRPLPSEAQLPGADQDPEELPGEHQLPGQQAADPVAMPGEDQLPGQLMPVDPPVGEDDQAIPVGPSAPILRLAFDGHTGEIRTLDISDGGRTLISGGEDKDLHVWRRTDIGGAGWLHRRTIRWPVARGPRGRMNGARLKHDLAAFAGHGAFGFNGEIRIVNAATGQLQQILANEQQGHRQVVVSLAWSPEETPRLASVDVYGRLIIWAADPVNGQWQPATWVKVDSETYNPEDAKALQTYFGRSFVPVTFLGSRYVVVPRYVGATTKTNPAGFLNWHLHRIDLQAPDQSVLLTHMEHATNVRCLSATDDGRVLASCDSGDNLGGRLGIWKFAEDGSIASAKQFRPDASPLFIDLDEAGKRLLVGTVGFGEAPPKLQLWDLEDDQPKLLSERNLKVNSYAGVLDADHREAIISQGNEIEIYPYDEEGQLQTPHRLSVPAKSVQTVAFGKQEGGYQIALGWNRNAEGKALLEGVFDLSESKLLGRAPIDPDNFLEAQRTATRWRIGWNQDGVPQLFEGDQARGVLPLLTARHGDPTAICTLPLPPTGTQEPGEKPATGAVIVGTSGRFNLYVYRADGSNPPQLLRQFRGHSGKVNALSTSSDGNYLVSGSDDATISVWNLQDLYTATKSVNRWGADFEIEGDQLLAVNVRQDGPLYFRGVRGGDRLTLLEWTDYDAESFSESDPQAMRQRLLDLPFDLMLQLKFTRLGRPGPHFHSYPAWRPLATLFVDQERQWAFWTPAGYYDASFNGHQRFGWQINGRTVEQPVNFFRAAQFREALERPDVMRRLLATGNLTSAMQQSVSQIGPSPGESAIVNQIESKPTIRLKRPLANEVITENSLIVEAEIEVPTGATLASPKAFISGVPAVSMEQIPNETAAGDNVATFRWSFRLPRDELLQLEIVAATELEAIDRVLVTLDHKPKVAPVTKPRLHIIAIGVSRYQDPQIQSLDFAAKAADDVVNLFQSYSSSIYRTTANQLVDQDATRPLWRLYAQTAAEELAKTVGPDDLVVMYLCGHGLRDRRTNQWYFVAADARFRDLMKDQYADCIAFSDLAALASLPCRKLAILDSCHSGAVQPMMRRDDLKSALRYLQDDVVLTLTASEGDEEAAEQREERLGRFTAALAAALKGEAAELDSDPNTVSLSEVIQYVSQRVSEESAQEDFAQHPTASPSYLLPTLSLPLTSR